MSNRQYTHTHDMIKISQHNNKDKAKTPQSNEQHISVGSEKSNFCHYFFFLYVFPAIKKLLAQHSVNDDHYKY